MSDDKDLNEPLPLFQTRIFIEPDGTVVFENLSEEMLEVARALDPEASFVCGPGSEGSNPQETNPPEDASEPGRDPEGATLGEPPDGPG